MTKRILIINGPNLNLLGTREPQVYGNTTFDDYYANLQTQYRNIEFAYFQSNIEGEIINALHAAITNADAIIINPAGYSHTSVAIADAISAIQLLVIEVHISNIHARETYRQHTLTGSKCLGVISGLGLRSYGLAVEYLIGIT